MLHTAAAPDGLMELLVRLAADPSLGGFALGGGTSLALRFGHRVSVDLDFFTRRGFDPAALRAGLGLDGAQSVNQAANSLTLDLEGTKLDFLRHAYELLEPPDVEQGVRMLSVPDVAAMKLNAVANRGAKKDFFDLAELVERHSLDRMLDWFERKYCDSDRFIVIRSLSWFEDAEAEPDPVTLRKLDWAAVKERIREAVSQLG